jgi:DNA polymerase I-like protein with 3'-5' exonuclease and polymerase domains
MEEAESLDVPVIAELRTGPNWHDMSPLELDE